MRISVSPRWAPALAAAFVLLIAAGVAYYALVADHTVTVSEADIQGQLDKSFPIQKTYNGLFTLTLSQPVVRLRAGSDRVGLGVTATVDALANTVHTSGSCAISGSPRYVPATRELDLDDAQVDDLQIHGLSDIFEGPLKSMAGLAAREYFSSHPLYRLDKPLFRSPVGEYTVKDLAIEDGRLRVTLGRAH